MVNVKGKYVFDKAQFAVANFEYKGFTFTSNGQTFYGIRVRPYSEGATVCWLEYINEDGTYTTAAFQDGGWDTNWDYGDGYKTVDFGSGADIPDELETWLDASATHKVMILKAGTYRFNDVVTRYAPVGQGVSVDLNFSCTTNYVTNDYQPHLNQTRYFTHISFDGGNDVVFGYRFADDNTYSDDLYLSYTYKEVDYGGWCDNYFTRELLEQGFSYGLIGQDLYDTYIDLFNQGYSFYGEGIKVITLEKDQEVADDFGTWFNANTKPMKVIKAGQYKFKEKIDLSTAPYVINPNNTGFDNCIVDINFRLPTITRVITQTEADEINYFLAQNGVTDTISAGTYTVIRSYDRICMCKRPNGDTCDYSMLYYDGNTETIPNTNVIQMLLGADDEVYNTYYDEPWCSEFDITYQTIILDTDQTVSEEFYTWFMANIAIPLATITYNGETIAQLNAGETATLSCEGMKMASDVVVKVNEVEDKIPEGYVKPEGTLELTVNNVEKDYPIDCSQYAKVTVNTAEPLKITDPTVLDNITDSPWGVGGNVFLYEGATTDSYENGAYYLLEDTEK